MKVLYGTGNPAKLRNMVERLQGLDVEIISLNDIDIELDTIDESGNDPLENARIKALSYYKKVKMPVFSCDSGLYIEGVARAHQPGVHVRRVNGRVLSDEEMIEHYTKLAFRYGGEVRARYKNAICLVMDEKNVYEYDGDDIASIDFIISSKPHEKRDEGFPLDSISIDPETGMYYMDIEWDKNNAQEVIMTKGFRSFFTNAFETYKQKQLVEVI